MMAVKTLTAIAVCYLVLGAARGEDLWPVNLERPISLPPQSLETIGLRYFLWTRENPKEPQVISAMNLTAFNASYFRTSRRTVLIIHGLDNQAHDNWVSDMCRHLLQSCLCTDPACLTIHVLQSCISYFPLLTTRPAAQPPACTIQWTYPDGTVSHQLLWFHTGTHTLVPASSSATSEILKKEDVNCIGVDWKNGSGNLFTYPQPVANVPVVGEQLCVMMKKFVVERNYSLLNIYIIGHSLGAHIAGDAGRRCPGVFRITGLEASGPMFENADKDVRLDPSDAMNVDAIYTDIEPLTGFGIARKIATLNFYPNGGEHMPGCPIKVLGILNVTNLKESVACDHFRAYRYFTDTIRSPEGYISYPCDSYENFKSGVCFPCPLPQGCPTMGYFAYRWFNMSDQKQTFYLNTGGNTPHYSSFRYKVTLTMNEKTSDSTYISFDGSGGNVTNHSMESGLTPRNSITEFMDSPMMLHPLRNVTFHWTSAILNLQKTPLGATKIDIQTGENGKTSSFCGKGTVSEGSVQVLSPCD